MSKPTRTQTDQPRTSDPARLGALATQREIHERFARRLQTEAYADWQTAISEFERISRSIRANPPAQRLVMIRRRADAGSAFDRAAREASDITPRTLAPEQSDRLRLADRVRDEMPLRERV